MRSLKVRMLTLVLAVVLVCSMTGCSGGSSSRSGGGNSGFSLSNIFGGGEKKAIQNTLEEFEYACHNMDLNAILNCIDPDVAQPIKLLIAIGSMATDTDYEEMLDMLVDQVFGEGLNPQEFLPKLELAVEDLKVKKDVAAAFAKINFELSGQQFTEPVYFYMIKVDDKWYISSVEFGN